MDILRHNRTQRRDQFTSLTANLQETRSFLRPVTEELTWITTIDEHPCAKEKNDSSGALFPSAFKFTNNQLSITDW